MRLLLSSPHTYPAAPEIGSGMHPTRFPSGSGFSIQDLVAKGLAELGHEVFYLMPEEPRRPLPEGVRFVPKLWLDVDLVHSIVGHDEAIGRQIHGARPWVATCHLTGEAAGNGKPYSPPHWIFVSQTCATHHGSDRYVRNGLDPEHYIFSETKDDYFLFMSAMYWGDGKGLDIALSLSNRLGFKLVIAGTDLTYEGIKRVTEMADKAGAMYVGDVRGKEKAELLAGAKGLLFPTRLDEAFGLVMVEALMSGTPVICSDKGACPEVISSDVGFVCKQEEDYFAAIEDVGKIRPAVCRDKAIREFHYQRMVADYLAEYQKEMDRNGN
jgi:glycosyltransferase involved in cell wall biosynthesis